MNAQTIDDVRHKHLVQDGPFAETKEQLGGYFLIDVPDLDAALNWLLAIRPAPEAELR